MGRPFRSSLLGGVLLALARHRLANAGADTTNSIKQAAEFGIGRGGKQMLAGPLVFLTDIDSLGLQTAQALRLTEAFHEETA